MARSGARRGARQAPEPARQAPLPGARALALAVALAALSALWALFQWTQLLIARAGGAAFCGLGGGDACMRAWDAPFASAVQRGSGLPVAGWGLLWSMLAFALPLCLLAQRAGSGRGAPAAAGDPTGLFASATAWTALGGVLAVMGLAAVLLVEGVLCSTCTLSYALALAYAASCWIAGIRPRAGARGAGRAGVRGAGLALLAGGLIYLALLVPGLRTPHAGDTALLPPGTPRAAAPAPAAPGGAAPAAVAPEPGDPLGRLLASLDPRVRQALADALAEYRASPEVPVRAPRSLVGPHDAPVRITEFTDALCGHCAGLHQALAQLRQLAAPGSFAIELRQFPLDGACNPAIPQASDDALRCSVARAEICMEGRPDAFDFSGALFAQQRSLEEKQIFAAAAPYLDEASLRACMASPRTEERLRDDIAWAEAHDIQGTPLVLINGRRASAIPPFLYAMVLAGGDPDHPGFAALPPPSATAQR